MRNYKNIFAATAVFAASLTAASPLFAGERGRGGPGGGPNGGGPNTPESVTVINGGQGGAGGQGGPGGNSSSNAQTGASSSGGNSFVSDNNFRAGAITGAPWMGGQFPAGECNPAFGISFGGGAPFVGSGGIGLQWIDVAGVALPNGYLVSDYVDAEREQRNEISKDLSKNEKQTLICIANAWKRNVASLQAQERMNIKSGEAHVTIAAINALKETELKKIEGSVQMAMPGIEHICNKNVLIVPKGSKVDVETRRVRRPFDKKDTSEFGHENCDGTTQNLVKGVINREPFLTDLSNVLRQRQQQSVHEGHTHPSSEESVPVRTP